MLLQPANATANDYRERIYLQTDKQLYLAGELLWLKIYLTDAKGNPTSLSKVGYVELLDETSAQIQVKVEIKDGIGEGWMELPLSLSSGYYHLTAYTRYMRNEDESVFFNKTIGVINTFRTEETLKIDTLLHKEPLSVSENTIDISTGTTRLSPRSAHEIRIDGLPEDLYSLAISITGKDDIPIVDNNTNISQWSNDLSSTAHSNIGNAFLPEYEGHIISGKVVDINSPESPIQGYISGLLGFVGDQINVFGAHADNKNDISFYTKRISGMHEIAVAAYSASDNRYRIDIQSPFVTHTEKKLPVFKVNPEWEESLLQRSIGVQTAYTFISDSLNRIDTDTSLFRWKPNNTYILDEYTRFTTMEEIIIEFIPSLTFRRKNGKRSIFVLTEEPAGYSAWGSLVLLDGVPIIDQEIIFQYDPLLLKKIDVYRGRYIYDEQLFEGIISLSSYANNYPTLKVDDSTQFYDYDGTQAHRHFYAPSYTSSKGNKRIPDFRHTLLWEPDLQTEGKSSIAVPFSTSDMTGEFQVVVEGLTKEGKVIRGVSFFEVWED